MPSEEVPQLPDVPEDPNLVDIAGMLRQVLGALAWLQRRVRQIDGTLIGLVQAQQVLQTHQVNIERVVSRCPADCPYRVEAEASAEETAQAIGEDGDAPR